MGPELNLLRLAQRARTTGPTCRTVCFNYVYLPDLILVQLRVIWRMIFGGNSVEM